MRLFCQTSNKCLTKSQTHSNLLRISLGIYYIRHRNKNHMPKRSENSVKRFLAGFPLSLLAVLCIATASLFPVPEMELMKNLTLADKWAHFVMYVGLTCAIWIDIIRQQQKLTFPKILLLTVALPIAFGGIMELAQAYLTTCRCGDWLDFAANSIGVLIALPIGLAFKKALKA